MLILTIRTDKPEAELGLFDDDKQLAYITWPAHRELSNTIHKKLASLLILQGRTLQDVRGIVCFKGPGSFTGLRIGLTVANTLAYSLGIPVVATMRNGWIVAGTEHLRNGESEKIILPEYGAEVRITLPKK
jgi:tRNA threonylcarbamoyladenosine biosynthesis protein TsaB